MLAREQAKVHLPEGHEGQYRHEGHEGHEGHDAGEDAGGGAREQRQRVPSVRLNRLLIYVNRFLREGNAVPVYVGESIFLLE